MLRQHDEFALSVRKEIEELTNSKDGSLAMHDFKEELLVLAATRLFENADKDKSDSLSYEEFNNILKKVGCTYGHTTLRQLRHVLDPDQDGACS
eukprot:SAG31_NODE_2173_length_6258_cov_2.493424_3_plen_94_part_00